MKAGLEQRFGFMIGDIARSFGTLFDQQARGRISLPRAQCRVVVYLSHFGEMNQAQLAAILEVTPMTVVRMLDRMEEGGWVKRVDDPNDRRALRVVATGKAERLVDQILALSDEVTAKATRGLTAQEKSTLLNLLTKVKANIASA